MFKGLADQLFEEQLKLHPLEESVTEAVKQRIGQDDFADVRQRLQDQLSKLASVPSKDPARRAQILAYYRERTLDRFEQFLSRVLDQVRENRLVLSGPREQIWLFFAARYSKGPFGRVRNHSMWASLPEELKRGLTKLFEDCQTDPFYPYFEESVHETPSYLYEHRPRAERARRQVRERSLEEDESLLGDRKARHERFSEFSRLSELLGQGPKVYSLQSCQIDSRLFQIGSQCWFGVLDREMACFQSGILLSRSLFPEDLEERDKKEVLEALNISPEMRIFPVSCLTRMARKINEHRDGISFPVLVVSVPHSNPRPGSLLDLFELACIIKEDKIYATGLYHPSLLGSVARIPEGHGDAIRVEQDRAQEPNLPCLETQWYACREACLALSDDLESSVPCFESALTSLG